MSIQDNAGINIIYVSNLLPIGYIYQCLLINIVCIEHAHSVMNGFLPTIMYNGTVNKYYVLNKAKENI